jgi:hypothetical protein
MLRATEVAHVRPPGHVPQAHSPQQQPCHGPERRAGLVWCCAAVCEMHGVGPYWERLGVLRGGMRPS